MSHVALVTGASRGIGLAIAEQLAAAGTRVLTPPRAELDLASPESIRAFAPRLAEVDILVNNAGINVLADLTSIQLDDWQQTLQVNTGAALQLLQLVTPRMRAQRWGRVVNVSSIFGVVSRPERGAYTAAKTALIGLTRTAALELGPHGILVNAICPGYVETDLTRQNNAPEALAAIAETIPLRRLAQPAEIATLVAFLCSERNSYLTGQALVIDGGFTCA